MYLFDILDGPNHQTNGEAIDNLTINAHPSEEAVVIKYRAINIRTRRFTGCQKLINLKDLNDDVDVQVLTNVVLEKCTIIPETMRQELEQVLYYLRKRSIHRNKPAREWSLSYIELFYEDTNEKNRGALCILELTKTTANLEVLIENETLIGALARVFREDWKKNFDLAATIIRIFVQFPYCSQFHAALSHHKIGALCMNAMEYELKRGDLWAAEIKTVDEKAARECRPLAIRKRQTLLAGCISLLINLAHDIDTELKMVRRDIVPML
ncbi:hypothetical protein KIN20_014889 [Parelaphostrongylus tenuis]|uniref:Uncharacterized protein n=1 Tax=Parelaphostrongylus tenuis TaxID=148309 RepID=A0AAD5MHL2_PARTN|nr:hypothetical protein KIN20_014889 [Parelaphostrongylus tenuis]